MGYDIVEDETDLIIGICDDLPLQEVIVAFEDQFQLALFLALERIQHVLRAVDNEDRRIFLGSLEIGRIIAQSEIVEHLLDVFALALRVLLVVKLHPSKILYQKDKRVRCNQDSIKK
jgi:hypothetical protein